ncbi:MAG: hypothetical protein QOH69_2050 [Actinomycetota bacterium]|jgi:hypothetical protein|nr:hypothetical protein [Actinomycetota bacterium]MDQ1551259.1 hypothetical protein [Actinomycetota bacterium]
MKWFTREWATGQLSEDESRAVRAEYTDHVNSILRYLIDDDADDLILNVNIHDGHVKRWSQTDGSIKLEMVTGDLQSGYQRVLLVFHDANLIGSGSLDEFDFGHARTELLYDEFDVASENAFEYRVLVWPEGELIVRFRSVTVQISEADEFDR